VACGSGRSPPTRRDCCVSLLLMTTHAVAAANTAAPADPSPAPRPPRPPPTVADGDAAILDINGDRQALVWVKKNG